MAKSKGNYCDSEKLEATWYDYAIALQYPQLESYRKSGLIWSRPKTDVRSVQKNGTIIHDPYVNDGIDYIVYDGKTFRSFSCITIDKLINFCNSGKSIAISELPNNTKYAGFRRKVPLNHSWTELANQVYSICSGIAKKFANINDPKYDDIVSTTNLAIITKLKNKKLKFTPGLAPVFSLMTMAIHRETFTIFNSDKRQDRLIATAKIKTNQTIVRSLSRNRSARRALVPMM